jgi:hypothetical protein
MQFLMDCMTHCTDTQRWIILWQATTERDWLILDWDWLILDWQATTDWDWLILDWDWLILDWDWLIVDWLILSTTTILPGGQRMPSTILCTGVLHI